MWIWEEGRPANMHWTGNALPVLISPWGGGHISCNERNFPVVVNI